MRFEGSSSLLLKCPEKGAGDGRTCLCKVSSSCLVTFPRGFLLRVVHSDSGGVVYEDIGTGSQVFRSGVVGVSTSFPCARVR